MTKEVYSYRQMDMLKSGILKLSQKYFRATRLLITEEEFVEAFIEEGHVPVLKQTQELVGAIGDLGLQPTQIKSGSIALNLSVEFATGRPPIIMPRYARSGLATSCPPSIRERIDSWVEERIHLGGLFGDALDTVYWLNTNCGNEGAMSVMFPALALCFREVDESAESNTAKRAHRILNAKSFGSLPVLPREVKTRMIEASQLLTACTLLDDTTQVVPPMMCAFSYNPYNTAPTRAHLIIENGRGQFL